MTSVKGLASTVHRCEMKRTLGQNGLSLLLSSDYLSKSVWEWPELVRVSEI